VFEKTCEHLKKRKNDVYLDLKKNVKKRKNVTT